MQLENQKHALSDWWTHINEIYSLYLLIIIIITPSVDVITSPLPAEEKYLVHSLFFLHQFFLARLSMRPSIPCLHRSLNLQKLCLNSPKEGKVNLSYNPRKSDSLVVKNSSLLLIPKCH